MLKNMIMFNAIIRAILNGYLNFSISSSLAMNSLTFDNTKYILNSLLSICLLTFLIVFPIANYVFLRKK
jgi:hypothetical protein